MAATWLRPISRAFGFGSSRIDLVSPLPRDECVRRLRDLTDGFWMIFGSRPLVGRVGESSFNLRKRIRGRNSFQTIARGIIQQDSGHTRLRCQFGVHPAAVGFMILWFGALSFFGGADIMNAIAGWSSSSARSLIAHTGAVVMFAFGLAVVGICRFSARHEQSEILKILTTTLEAREES